MKAVVVYESLWGNTAAAARAVAEGIGRGTPALCTDEADGTALADVDLIVVGAPVLGFALPTEKMRENIRTTSQRAPQPPDLAHPSLRSWLEALPHGSGRCAAFETRLRITAGGATGAILERLEKAGYRELGEARRFVVKGRYGPLRDGEVEKARAWGAELARAMEG